MTNTRNMLLATSGVSTEALAVENSVILEDGDSEHFTKTFSGTPANQKKFTMSGWYKRGDMGAGEHFFGAGTGTSTGRIQAYWDGSDRAHFEVYHGSGWNSITSTRVFRDAHAFYHLMFVYDVDNSTSADKLQIWCNGVRITAFDSSSYPTSSIDHLMFSNSTAMVLFNSGDNAYFTGHGAEIVGYDGVALTDMSKLGEKNNEGIWIPVSPKQSFTGNSFYLDFADGSAMGNDVSGLNNDFTPQNSPAQSNDSPTKNYATWSPLNKHSGVTLSHANTKVTGGGATQGGTFSTIKVPSGIKVYVEMTCTSSNTTMTGAVKATSLLLSDVSKTFDDLAARDGRMLHAGSGDVYYDDSITTPISNYAPNDSVPVTHMIALDLVNDKIYWGDAGVGSSGWSDGSGSFNQAFGSASGVDLEADLDWFFAAKPYNGTIELNCGQKAFTVSPPSGYISGLSAALLNENQTPALTINDGSSYMQTTLYAGNNSGGSSQNVDQSGMGGTFQPDFVWIKNRDQNDAHILTDAVRGVTKVMYSDVVDDEDTDADTLTAWRVDGFTVGADDKVNTNTENYVAWQWLGANTTAVPSGSSGISSLSVSANTTSGFSVGTFTGQSSGTGVVAHGLGGEPDWIIVKPRAVNESWLVWHSAIHAKSSNGNRLFLESDAVNGSGGASISAVSSETFTIPDDSFYHSRTFLFYAWREIPGFSKFGTYSAGTHLPIINLDFKPHLAIFKRTDATGEWIMADTARETHDNKETRRLYADDNAAENSGTERIVFGSNFIHVRAAHGSADPNVGGTYIYSIFGENSFAGTTPVTAY